MADIDLPLAGSTAWAGPLNAAIEAINSDVETRAKDSEVVHTSGNEAIAGVKTFANGINVPDASLSISDVNGLQAALDGAGGGGGVGTIDPVAGQIAIDINGTPFVGSRTGEESLGALASGTNSIAIGGGVTEASGSGSLALGKDAQATASYAAALGGAARATSSGATAIGDGAEATDVNAVAVGWAAKATGSHSVAIGDNASAAELEAVAVGRDSSVSGQSAIAIGEHASASGDQGVATGRWATAVEDNAVAVGSFALSRQSAAAIGRDSLAGGYSSVAIGQTARTLAPGSASILSDSSGTSGGVGLREHAQVNVRDLHVKRNPVDPNGDYPDNSETGVIVHSPNGSAWRITVSNAGALTATAITLPTEPRWTKVTPAGSSAWSSIACSADGTKAVAVVYGGGVYTSTNSGSTWAVKSGAGTGFHDRVQMSSDGTKILASRGNTHRLSTDSGTNWSTITLPPDGFGNYRMSASDDFGLLALVRGSDLHLSTNSGSSWTRKLPEISFGNVAVSGNGLVIAAHANDGTVQLSVDGGATWAPQPPIGNYMVGFALSQSGDTFITADMNDRMMISWDGSSWSTSGAPAGATLAQFANSLSLSSDGMRGVTVTPPLGLYVCVDGTWDYVQASGGNDFTGACVSRDGSRVYAVRSNGAIFTSTLPLPAA